MLFVCFFSLTLTSRVSVAYWLSNDAPGDGVIYSRLAKNILENGVYSIDEQAPYSPTLIRLPGYPLFIAGVYSVFGHDNNTAVRIVQGVVDTFTCVIAAMLAWMWTEPRRRRWRTSVVAFALAAVCPFITVYASMILTETLTTFLMAAMALTATFAIRSVRKTSSAAWWVATGILGGLSVLLRPDAGLFCLGIGVTLIVAELVRPVTPVTRETRTTFGGRTLAAVWKGAVFTLAFVLVLVPWAIRNYRLFGVFQPLAPMHAEMPGEFVSHGYFHWLRTWVDDSRFTEPMLWNLGEKPIRMESIPASAFDTPEERDRVAALLEKYNNPPGSNNPNDASSDEDTSDSADSDTGDEDPGDSADNSPDNTSDESDDQSADAGDEDENTKYVVAMTPEIDAEFERLAQERASRSPVRTYLWLPIKRAGALWFDSHSLYYPFGGQMSPISDLDYDVSQQYWLPAFTILTWIYTLLGIGGVIAFWRVRANRKQLRWLVLILLMTLPRIVFFATIENPEPRYVVELFLFTAILGGIYLGTRVTRVASNDVTVSDRLVSLDVFRGITIAAMTLVNEPGTWDAVYPPLVHGEWNSATPTDWIFPFFLFIVGVSISISLSGKEAGRQLYAKIVKRGALLFALGLMLEAFPFYNIWTAAWVHPAHLRIMGVLQRIAICYVVTSILFLKTNWRTQVAVVAVILLAYWALLTLVNVPGCEVTTINDPACNLAAYIDRIALTPGHIWEQSKVFDPDGLLATLPAIATTLIGVLAGTWLRARPKLRSMFVVGLAMLTVGFVWSIWFPLNKSLWSSSYVLYTGGLAGLFLAALYWIVDVKGYRRWSVPFVVFGMNAIALYVGTTLFGKTLETVELAAPHDATVTLQEAIFNGVFLPLAEPVNASLLYAITFVLIWLAIMWILYWRKVFIKI